MINSACYLAGALVLFRFVRPAFGGVAALAGLAVMLFTPSLFMWSISALKEPSYTLDRRDRTRVRGADGSLAQSSRPACSGCSA